MPVYSGWLTPAPLKATRDTTVVDLGMYNVDNLTNRTAHTTHAQVFASKSNACAENAKHIRYTPYAHRREPCLLAPLPPASHTRNRGRSQTCPTQDTCALSTTCRLDKTFSARANCSDCKACSGCSARKCTRVMSPTSLDVSPRRRSMLRSCRRQCLDSGRRCCHGSDDALRRD